MIVIPAIDLHGGRCVRLFRGDPTAETVYDADPVEVQGLAEAGGMELRIFRRDGQRFSSSHRPSLAEAPDSNADIMAELLNTKNGQTWQSIPVAVFYTKNLEYLYHYTEYPAIYLKDAVVGGIRAARQGDVAYGRVVLPETERESAAAFGIHPALLDAALHALAGVDTGERPEVKVCHSCR